MTLRRRLVLIGAVIWAVLAAAWFLDLPVLGKSGPLGWLAFVLALLPLVLVSELLLMLRDWFVARRKEGQSDA